MIRLIVRAETSINQEQALTNYRTFDIEHKELEAFLSDPGYCTAACVVGAEKLPDADMRLATATAQIVRRGDED